ncbi:MAG: hypothetical protein HF308_14350 [Ignavibacteria bacterium]|nr:hypothetical protein [Ignavibacteria bacterium]
MKILITINLGTLEYFDESTNQFITEDGGIVRFEYTLKTVYDWEFKWRKPFLKGELTEEESIDFYKMMALDPVNEGFLTGETAKLLADYIKDSSTATVFSAGPEGQNGYQGPSKGKIYTSEEIYALMFSAGVPLEFENRNLNRLMVILRIISTYNNPPKQMSQQDILRQNASINAQRRAMLNTKG